MFKNNVFKVSVDTKRWMKAAAVRAIKTTAQAGTASIGAAAVMGQVDWKYVLSAALLAGILSLLNSVTGLPEVESEEQLV